MRIKIWGARGSLPTPMTTPDLQDRLREALQRSKGINLDDPAAIERFIDRLPPYISHIASGHTTCVEVRVNGALFIFDMGSGIRPFGDELMRQEFGRGEGNAHIFISHTHWDHVEGFPYFMPAFVPGNRINIYTPFADLEERLRHVMRAPSFFPVDLDYMGASRNFVTLDPSKPHDIAGVHVELLALNHPGGSYAYKITHGGKTFIFATDAEYPKMDHESTAIYEDFYRGADALFFDAMYTYTDSVNSKVDWGHSSANAGAELAWRARVKRLILTHHDPRANDQKLWQNVDDADRLLRHQAARRGDESGIFVKVMLAYEGLTLDL